MRPPLHHGLHIPPVCRFKHCCTPLLLSAVAVHVGLRHEGTHYVSLVCVVVFAVAEGGGAVLRGLRGGSSLQGPAARESPRMPCASRSHSMRPRSPLAFFAFAQRPLGVFEGALKSLGFPGSSEAGHACQLAGRHALAAGR